MKKREKIISIILAVLSIISIGVNTYAHSGRTDANGGHKDNKNKSGLGSYHYHCGGHPAHLHTNGICPYSSNKPNSKETSSSTPSQNDSSSSASNSKDTSSATPSPNATSNASSKNDASTSSSNKNNTSSSSSANTKETQTTPTTIEITKLEIQEDIENLEVGETKVLTVTITPSNATNKNLTWSSSDESIVAVTETGEITAKKAGIADITVVSANGKTSAIKINVEETKKEATSSIIKTSVTSKTNSVNENITKNEEDTSLLGGTLILALLGVGGYLGYKKYKNTK